MAERRFVVIQARRASTRLPDKVLLDLHGRPVLTHVVARCLAIPGITGVVCAIPDAPGHEPLAAIARAAGADIFAGPEQDVLERYRGAAAMAGASVADIVLRVTSDCPLIDPQVCAAVLDLRAATGADYASNNMPPGWPHGLDCEAFTMSALSRAAAEAIQPEERKHVTPWLRRHPDLTRAALPGPGGRLTGERWTLDHPEDLAFFRALLPRLPAWPALPGWREIVQVLDAHPDIRAINQGKRDPARIPVPG